MDLGHMTLDREIISLTQQRIKRKERGEKDGLLSSVQQLHFFYLRNRILNSH